MSNMISGKVVQVSTPNERVIGSDRSWAKDYFVVEDSFMGNSGEVKNLVKFDVISNGVRPRWREWNLSKGDNVEVMFSVRSHLYDGNGKWYTELTAYSIKKIEQAPTELVVDEADNDDDLPW